MNPGGGYIDGDSYRIDVYLEPEAEVLLTTQSSTKIYKTMKQAVIQETNIFLKKGSFLEYLPDAVIAYEHARFKQRTIIRMERGASLVCADILTPGWAPDGTNFRYDLLQSRMEIYVADKLVLFDHLKLEPAQDIEGLGSMEGYTHFGSMIVIDDGVDGEFLDQLYDELSSCLEASIGLSMLSIHGFVLRVLANRTQDVEKVFSICQGMVREKALGKMPVFLRKY
ncbi:urease accessory protein UreD [Aneurinibacillus tyrosinisolvens]|uniref:urease accessory protein UreD n=1 Tax=Aneurinibacillus tyrosinisolvens TaxID=1443435 RepID=UPI0009E2D99D|nr:urease accessory protein UreD [Aneurinibacillus tyrosinisolvens]